LYLLSAHAVYPDYLFFPNDYTAPEQWGLATPRFRRPMRNTPSPNRYVFRIAWLVLGIASWPDFAKEHPTKL
jgi:hypothetical protein